MGPADLEIICLKCLFLKNDASSVHIARSAGMPHGLNKTVCFFLIDVACHILIVPNV